MKTIKTFFTQPIYYGLMALWVVAYYAYGMKGLFWIMAVTIVPALIFLSIIVLIAKDKFEKLSKIAEDEPERFKRIIEQI